MAVFAYKVMDDRRSMLSGTIAADSPRQARDLLRARGFTIQDVKHHSNGAAAGDQSSWWNRVAPTLVRRRCRGQLTGFIREISTLLGVGIPLLEALDSAVAQHRGVFRTTLLTVRDRVAAGTSFADAMRQQPLVFDQMTTAMTEVGESAGALDTVLERLADFKERASQFKDRVSTALIYPLIVMTMAIASSIFLMTFVVPSLLNGLLQAGHPIPLPTRIVKGLSDFLLADGVYLAIGAVAVVLLVIALMRTDRCRMLWHRAYLKIPIAGRMARMQAVVRICVVVSTLMRSGVVFLRALEIAEQSTRNRVLKAALARCRGAVGAGRDIAQALEGTGAFPALMVQIFSVGQQSGKLEEMLERLASDYDRRIGTASQRLTAMLEPLLIVFMVIVVGFIAFATILPILEAGDVL